MRLFPPHTLCTHTHTRTHHTHAVEKYVRPHVRSAGPPASTLLPSELGAHLGGLGCQGRCPLAVLRSTQLAATQLAAAAAAASRDEAAARAMSVKARLISMSSSFLSSSLLTKTCSLAEPSTAGGGANLSPM